MTGAPTVIPASLFMLSLAFSLSLYTRGASNASAAAALRRLSGGGSGGTTGALCLALTNVGMQRCNLKTGFSKAFIVVARFEGPPVYAACCWAAAGACVNHCPPPRSFCHKDSLLTAQQMRTPRPLRAHVEATQGEHWPCTFASMAALACLCMRHIMNADGAGWMADGGADSEGFFESIEVACMLWLINT